MSDEEVDYSEVDWTEQESEIEALQVIFPDEFKLIQQKPYKFTIQINSNQEAQDNYLKMNLSVQLPHNYPNKVPFMLLKNLSPEYLNNQMIDKYEQEIRMRAHESLGSQMVFDICELLREKIGEINDKVLGKYNEIIKAKEEEEIQQATPKMSNMDTLNYTPVNKDTFGKWCAQFLEKLKQEEEAQKTEVDLRKTGKQLFMEKGALELEDLTLDDSQIEQVVDPELELLQLQEEEKNYDGDQNDDVELKEGALYDKDLFAQELAEYGEEDVDFD